MQKEKVELLCDIEKFARQNGYPVIVSQTQNFFKDFLKDKNFTNILEIGTCIGFSGSLMLLLQDKANLTTIELYQEKADIAMQNFKLLGLNDRVNLIVGDAAEHIENLDMKFDLIFLDGAKGQYMRYQNTLIEKLNVGGYLIADNVLFRGWVQKDKEQIVPHRIRTMVNNLRTYLDMLDNREDIQHQVLNVGDGISVARKLK